MRIDYLDDHADLIPLLAKWHTEAFGGANPEMTVEKRTERLQSHLGKVSIPLTVVAFEGDEPVGSTSLVQHDMSTHLELSPWAAAVYVHPDHRRQGIGTALMHRIEEEAKRLGVKELFLFTPDVHAFYRTMGWRTISVEKFRGLEVTIMKKELVA